MGVCPRLKFYNITLIICLGYDFILIVHLSFYAIQLLSPGFYKIVITSVHLSSVRYGSSLTIGRNSTKSGV